MAGSFPSCWSANRGLKGRYQPIARLQVPQIAARFCRGHDELRNYLRPVPAATSMFPSTGRRTLFLRRTATVLDILAAVGRNAGAQNDIHAFAYQVHQPVALADMKWNAGRYGSNSLRAIPP